MMADVARSIVEGYVAPRAAMRRLLDGGHGLQTALLMLALGYLVETMLVIVTPGGAEVDASMGMHLLNVPLQIGLFFLLAGMVHAIGGAFGGTGGLRGAQLVVGWHALVTSPMTPLMVGFTSAFRLEPGGEGALAPGSEVAGGVVMLAFVYVAVWFWLLANYVAELHGFTRIWGVLGVVVGVAFACAMLLSAVMGALA